MIISLRKKEKQKKVVRFLRDIYIRLDLQEPYEPYILYDECEDQFLIDHRAIAKRIFKML